jgi:cell division protein FtsQ
MPAAMRGAGRSSAKARSKSSATAVKSRPTPAGAGAAGRSPMSFSPRVIFAVSGLAVAGVVAIVLATDHRGARVVQAAGDAFIQGTADAGFRLQTVRLDGASPQSAADILRAAGLARGAPLLSLDLAGVRSRVQQVGWVRSARVVRLFPDSVVIAVDERRLEAVWEHAGHTGVIDAAGVVAPEADPGKFASLPLVVGDGANTAAAAILPLIQARPRLTDRLDALVRVDSRRWDLRLKDGTIVQLPAASEEAALIRLDQLDQQSRILDLGFSRIDLRDPEMVAVRPRENPVAATGANGAG